MPDSPGTGTTKGPAVLETVIQILLFAVIAVSLIGCVRLKTEITWRRARRATIAELSPAIRANKRLYQKAA